MTDEITAECRKALLDAFLRSSSPEFPPSGNVQDDSPEHAASLSIVEHAQLCWGGCGQAILGRFTALLEYVRTVRWLDEMRWPSESLDGILKQNAQQSGLSVKEFRRDLLSKARNTVVMASIVPQLIVLRTDVGGLHARGDVVVCREPVEGPDAHTTPLFLANMLTPVAAIPLNLPIGVLWHWFFQETARSADCALLGHPYVPLIVLTEASAPASAVFRDWGMNFANFLRGKRFVVGKGRPLGSRAIGPVEFEATYPHVYSQLLETLGKRPTQIEVAGNLGIEERTLRSYLALYGQPWPPHL